MKAILNNVDKEKVELMKYKLKGINPVLVVAGLVEKDGKYFIAKRLTGNEQARGKWEFPGGKVELNEEEDKAIEREFKEEFKLNIKADKFLTYAIYEYPTRTIDLKLWHAVVLDDEFEMDEKDHDQYKWVSFEEIENYDLAPADMVLYNKVKEQK